MPLPTSTNAGHFVVLADGMGKWRKGDVLAATMLAGNGVDIERLLVNRALRAASEHEAGQHHVDLNDPHRALSYEHQLAEKDTHILRLTARVAHLEEQIAAGAQIPAAAQATAIQAAHQAALIEEKDRAIRNLEAQLTELQARFAAVADKPAPAPLKVAAEPAAPVKPAIPALAVLMGETPPVDAPKVEAPKAEAPKVEAPKVEAPVAPAVKEPAAAKEPKEPKKPAKTAPESASDGVSNGASSSPSQIRRVA